MVNFPQRATVSFALHPWTCGVLVQVVGQGFDNLCPRREVRTGVGRLVREALMIGSNPSSSDWTWALVTVKFFLHSHQ